MADKISSEVHKSPIDIERYQYGKLNITVLQAEHDIALWSQQYPVYKDIIATADVVIPEYLTKEWEREIKDPLMVEYTHIDKLNGYFKKVEEVIASNKKKVLVLDPAHDSKFALINLFYAGELTAGAIGTVAAKKLLSTTDKAADQQTTNPVKKAAQWTRRNFLRTTTVGSIGLFLSGALDFASYEAELATGTPSIVPNEAVFRRVIISRGITEYEKRQTGPVDVVFIYPKTHWKQIKDFMTNPIRDTLFRAYSTLKRNSGLKESFFMGREYHHNGKEFTKDGEFEIN